MSTRVLLALFVVGCSASTAPVDVSHTVLLTNPSQNEYDGLVVSKPTEALRVQFMVPAGLRACLRFRESQLRGDSMVVIGSYFVNDITHIVGDTLRGGPNWTWDGVTASSAPAC